MRKSLGIEAIVLGAIVLSYGGRASAQVAFTPIAPVACPTMTTFAWSWNSLSVEDGVEPNGVDIAGHPSGLGPVVYANNQRQKRFIIANAYVRNFGYHYAFWDTQLPGDQLTLQQPGHLSVAMAGTRSSPGWVSVGSSTPLQQSPIEATFWTNSAVNYAGFNIDQVRFCGNGTPGSISTSAMANGVRYAGFLLGTNDVVMQWTSAPHTGQIVNIAVWGNDNFDVDLYVRCGAAPTPTNYTARGYTAGGEVLSITPNQCAWPSVLYVTTHAYSGSGQFNIVAARGISPNKATGFTIALEGVSSAELETIGHTIRKATKMFFGVTEGQWLLSPIQLVYFPENSISFSGSACRNACVAVTGRHCDACFIRETGRAQADFAVVMPSNYWSSANTLSHEWGHYFLELGDEYNKSAGDCNSCGHSVMSSSWNYTHNICIGGSNNNHNTDGDLGCSPSAEPPAWPNANEVYTHHATTPDIFDFQSHDFNSLPVITSY